MERLDSLYEGNQGQVLHRLRVVTREEYSKELIKLLANTKLTREIHQLRLPDETCIDLFAEETNDLTELRIVFL